MNGKYEFIHIKVGCAGCKGAVATDTAAIDAVYKKQVTDMLCGYPMDNAACEDPSVRREKRLSAGGERIR